MDLTALRMQASRIAAFVAEGTPRLQIGSGAPFDASVRPLSAEQLVQLPELDVDLVEITVAASALSVLPKKGAVLRTVSGAATPAAYRVVEPSVPTPAAISYALICQIIPAS